MVGKVCHISLQPLGDIGVHLMEAMEQRLEEAYGCDLKVLPVRPLPVTAWMAARRQYDSTHLLLFLESVFPADTGKVLAVCDVDICSPIMTFVFGEAELPGRFAVMSLHRLRQEVYGLPPDPDLFRERAAKEAVHEVGHTFGLRHCYRYNCVMFPSDTVEATDLKPVNLCPRCMGRLAESTGR